MTIRNAPVHNWAGDPRTAPKWDEDPYESGAPNILALLDYLIDNVGGGSMGIHLDRNIRNGSRRSEHSWGAALDWGTHQAQHDYITGFGGRFGKTLTRSEHLEATDWLVDHSAELGIQAIVDIGRSWKSDRIHNGERGWKPYNSGYTGHCHIVTSLDDFSNARPIAQRLAPPPPPLAPPTKDTPMLAFFYRHLDHPHLFYVNGGVTHVSGPTRDFLEHQHRALTGKDIPRLENRDTQQYDAFMRAVGQW